MALETHTKFNYKRIGDCQLIPFTSEQLAALNHSGWFQIIAMPDDTETTLNEMRRLANLLGTRAFSRGSLIEEVISPLSPADAHPNSLSMKYGLDSLPLHVELSHRRIPCRWLLLGCLDPGTPSALTLLLDWRSLSFSPQEYALLKDSPLLIRSGRNSFYTTILSPNSDFIRYDLGCIEAIDKRGQAALELMKQRLAVATPYIHQWKQGEILVIDNWRVLHGRGPSNYNSHRRLARILINA